MLVGAVSNCGEQICDYLNHVVWRLDCLFRDRERWGIGFEVALPMTSMVWTFICSAFEIFVFMWSLLASSSQRTWWALRE